MPTGSCGRCALLRLVLVPGAKPELGANPHSELGGDAEGAGRIRRIARPTRIGHVACELRQPAQVRTERRGDNLGAIEHAGEFGELGKVVGACRSNLALLQERFQVCLNGRKSISARTTHASLPGFIERDALGQDRLQN